MLKRIFLIALVFLAMTGSLSAADFLSKKLEVIGKEVSDFQLRDYDGKSYRLASQRGKIVVLYFWSVNCPFIERYEERFRKLIRDFSREDVMFWAIDANHNEDEDKILAAVEDRDIRYPILLDLRNKIADRFGAITTPHVFIIDPKGVLVYEGPVDDQGWSKKNTVKIEYVRDVLKALGAKKKSPYKAIKPFGCTIRRA